MRKKLSFIVSSDWHIWKNPPNFRIQENWDQAQMRPFVQMRAFCEERNPEAIWIVAGDLFDYFNPPPETINLLLSHLPKKCYAIPGQHDLQNHSLSLIKKTAFWTLVESRAIIFPPIGVEYTIPEIPGFSFFFYPWGTLEEESRKKVGRKLEETRVLIGHSYVWSNQKNRYQGKEIPEGKVTGIRDIEQFDMAFFGDNHIPFRCKVGNCQIFNCGTLNRRKRDEEKHEVGFYAIYEDASWEFVPFNCEEDIYEEQVANSKKTNKNSFLETLRKSQQEDVDFKSLVRRKAGEGTEQRIILDQIFNKYEQRREL